MNPGPVEEGAKVAAGITDALKSSPMLLTMIVMQALTLIGIGWGVHERNAMFSAEIQRLSEERQEVVKACIGNKT